jgi:hypothetical protein
VGPDGDVVTTAVVVGVGAVVCVVAEATVCGRTDAADRESGGPAGDRVAVRAGRAAVVVVEVEVPSVVAVDGLDVTGPAVEDVDGSAGSVAARSAVPPAPPQAEPASIRTAPRATGRRRTAATLPAAPSKNLRLKRGLAG